jgi:hypothetical protein
MYSGHNRFQRRKRKVSGRTSQGLQRLVGQGGQQIRGSSRFNGPNEMEKGKFVEGVCFKEMMRHKEICGLQVELMQLT